MTKRFYFHRSCSYRCVVVLCKLGIVSVTVPLLGSYTIGWWYIPLLHLYYVAVRIFNEWNWWPGWVVRWLCFNNLRRTDRMSHSIRAKLTSAISMSAIYGRADWFSMFNINPAKFFMGDTGVMALGILRLAWWPYLTNNRITPACHCCHTADWVWLSDHPRPFLKNFVTAKNISITQFQPHLRSDGLAGDPDHNAVLDDQCYWRHYWSHHLFSFDSKIPPLR